MTTTVVKKPPSVDELLLKIDGVIDQLQVIRHMAELLFEEEYADGVEPRVGRSA